MPVRYRAVKRKLLNGEFKGEERFYAVARSTYVCDLDRVCGLVSRATKISDAEVVATIKGFLWVCQMELTNGATLGLGDMGYLRVVLRSEGVPSADELTAAHIKGARVVFRASPKLAQTVQNLKYEVYKPETIYIGQPLPPDLDDD